jgi:hypothetical protein
VPEAILPKQRGRGGMENAQCFPHPHTTGDDDGQISNEALHSQSPWYKIPVSSPRTAHKSETAIVYAI